MEYEPRRFKKYAIRKEKEEDFPFPEPGEVDLGRLPISFFEDGSEEDIILRTQGRIKGKRF